MFFVRLPLLPEYAAHANDCGLVDQQLGSLVRGGSIQEEEVDAYKFTFSRRGEREGDRGRGWQGKYRVKEIGKGREWGGESGSEWGGGSGSWKEKGEGYKTYEFNS